MRELTTIGDPAWGGIYSSRMTRRMWAHPVMPRVQTRTRDPWHMSAATDPTANAQSAAGGVQIDSNVTATAQALLAMLVNQGVPYEGTVNLTVEAFQNALLAAGNAMTYGADGKYGQEVAGFLSQVLGTNVPAPNTTAPGTVTPATPATPTPTPTPQVQQAGMGSGALLWLAILAAVGFAVAEAMKKKRGPRRGNPCERMHHKRMPRATVLVLR